MNLTINKNCTFAAVQIHRRDLDEGSVLVDSNEWSEAMPLEMEHINNLPW